MASLKLVFQFILKGLWLGFLHNFIILFITGVIWFNSIVAWVYLWMYIIPLGLIIGIINGFVLGILTIAWTGKIVYFYKYAMIGVATTTIFCAMLIYVLLSPNQYPALAPMFYFIIIPALSGYMGYQMCMWHVHQPTSKFDLSAQVYP